MKVKSYSLARLFGRNIFLYPSKCEFLLIDTLQRISKNSWRKKIFNISASFLFYSKFGRIFSKDANEVSTLKNSINITKLIESFQNSLGLHDLSAVFFYPPQLERERLYCYIYKNNKCIAFSKIAFDFENISYLQNEEWGILFAQRINKTFSLPVVKTSHYSPSIGFIAYEPMNDISQKGISNFEDIVFKVRNEIVGLLRSVNLIELKWWERVQLIENFQAGKFKKYIRLLGYEKLIVGNAQGDLTYNNIFFQGSLPIIIDWEYSSTEAPYMTDEISFYLDKYQRVIRNNTHKGFSFIINEISNKCSKEINGERIFNSLMAFAYLYSAGNSQAIMVINNWNLFDEELVNELQK